MNDLRIASITATLLGKIWEQEKVMKPIIEPIELTSVRDNTLDLMVMTYEFAKLIAVADHAPQSPRELGMAAAQAAIEAMAMIEQYQASKQ